WPSIWHSLCILSMVKFFKFFPPPHCSFFSFAVLALEQSPDTVIKEGQSVNLECSKKKSSNRAMYWFILPSEKNSSVTQMVYAYEGVNAVVEKGFESHFKSSNIQGDSITLSIEHAFLNDSGTYYCGAEHKLVPAQPGPATHLSGTQTRKCLPEVSLPFCPFLLFCAFLLPDCGSTIRLPHSPILLHDSSELWHLLKSHLLLHTHAHTQQEARGAEYKHLMTACRCPSPPFLDSQQPL
uniref:Ig-like domain-containing protein n=1 Tax=Serinus canaria TaxID=9135 RepID=A0A8C9NP03_SERCA